MIDAGSTELNNKWKNVLHNQADDYIIPESDVNIMCPYDCVSTSGNTVTGYNTESYCNVNALATSTTTINRNKKIATFEWNYWVLDGTFEVLDDNETVKGFVSTAISDENCEYDVNPFIFFDNVNSFNLRKNQTLKFNPPTNEVPASITIQSLNGSSVINNIEFNIEEMLEEDNLTEREYVNLYSSAINTSSLNARAVIIFTKTLMPYRRARLTEYNNGYKFFKNKFDLLSFNHNRTVALAMDELPQNDLTVSFVDLEGVFDSERVDSPFKVKFNNSHRFYIYYGYNFDDIGWNYVMGDYLSFNELEINRDSVETTIKAQSTLQLYNRTYGADNLDTVIYSGGSYTHTKSAPYNWTTFKGFMTAISSLLSIGDFSYSSNDIPNLNVSLEEWQNYLRSTTIISSEDNFTRTSLKELIQQICAFLRCALVRQANGGLKLEYLYPDSVTQIDTIEAINVFSYPTKTTGEQYKYISINTPHIDPKQSDDENTENSTGGGGATLYMYPARKRFTVSASTGSEETSTNQNIIPINYRDFRVGCWTWNAGIWQNYANHFSKMKKNTRFELGETMLCPLWQVTDAIRVYYGDTYSSFYGRIEKIEINYDGSFKGALTLCAFNE